MKLDVVTVNQLVWVLQLSSTQRVCITNQLVWVGFEEVFGEGWLFSGAEWVLTELLSVGFGITSASFTLCCRFSQFIQITGLSKVGSEQLHYIPDFFLQPTGETHIELSFRLIKLLLIFLHHPQVLQFVEFANYSLGLCPEILHMLLLQIQATSYGLSLLENLDTRYQLTI